MALNVAVQMDPIERINIRGDSTFALLLEAQRRNHEISYYTPERLAMVDGHDPEIGAVLPTHQLHANANSHSSTFPLQ